LVEILLRQQSKNDFIFPPYLTDASAPAGEIWTPDIASFHLNAILMFWQILTSHCLIASIFADVQLMLMLLYDFKYCNVIVWVHLCAFQALAVAWEKWTLRLLHCNIWTVLCPPSADALCCYNTKLASATCLIAN